MKTLKEVLDKICAEMHLPDKVYIRGTKEKDLIQFHHGLGTQIRNTFNLWAGNPELFTDMELPLDTHPDEVSQLIIIALWKRLQNEP